MKLTKRTIDALSYRYAPAKKKDIHWDDEIAGFGLRVYPTNKKAFVLFYRHNNRQRLYTLGKYGVLTLDQARAKARRTLVDVLDGHDPLEERNQQRHGETMTDLCTAYLERHAKPHKKSWGKDESRIKRHILPPWRMRQVKSINRSAIAELHHDIGDDSGKYEANRVLQMLSKIFDLATDWGYLDPGTDNPAKKIKKFKEEKRDRWVTPEELPALGEAIQAEENLYARAAIWLYLLTSARKMEILSAKWEHLDVARKTLRVPKTKSGKVHHIPLNEPAMNLLANLPRLEDNPYVLPGRNNGKPLVNVDKPWRRVRKAAGLEDVRLHDLRRTVGSWLAQGGAPLVLVGKALNQKSLAATQVYARFGDEQLRTALEEHGAKISEAARDALPALTKKK